MASHGRGTNVIDPDASTINRRPSAWVGTTCGRGSSGALGLLGLLAIASIAVGGLWVRPAGAEEGRAAPGADQPDACAPFDHEHAAWTVVLSRYVRRGVVDYVGFRRDGQPALSAYLASLERVCPGEHVSWTRAQKLAFWINAYNAYTVRLILDNYPIESIREIGFLPSAAFRTDFIPMEKLRGATLSLDDIEHEILRKEIGDSRTHFAIVCASKSCPVLRSEAYRAPIIDRQLDNAARGFLRDPTRNRYNASARTLWLSSIFDWFRDDFERSAGTLEAFVARYADETTASALRAGGVRLEFLDYDWSLNGR